jgi:hypothetical protein
MIHASLNLLLAGLLVFCPFFCLPQGAQVESAARQAGCCHGQFSLSPVACDGIEANRKSKVLSKTCCGPEAPAPAQDRLPQAPEDEPHDCLCRGAVVGFKGELSDLRFDSSIAPSFVSVDECQTIGRTLAAGAFRAPRARHFPPSSGRDICILRGLLLI